MQAKFKVRQDLSFWGYGDDKFEPGGEYTVDDVSPGLAEAIVAAEAAGSLYDVEFDGHVAPVEPDYVSLDKLTVAMGERGEDGRYTGPWMLGHLEQLVVDQAQGGNIEIGGEA